MRELPRHYSFRYLITIAILLIAILFISLFSFFSYIEARGDLLEKDQALRDQTERHLSQSVVLLDRGLGLFDATFDYQLKQVFTPFVEEYERSGRDPSRMDFARVKQTIESRIEGTVDLYMINQDGIIEYTTFDPDKGLDFKQWPEVHTFLTNLRLGNEFSADRIVYGPSKVLRKYAYLPTSDHRYLLELGLVMEGYKEERIQFSYKKVAEGAAIGNPAIVGVYFYDSTGRMIGTSDYTPGEEVIGHILEAYEREATIETIDEGNQTFTQFLYIDLDVGEHASAPQMNIIAQVIYSTAALDAELADLLSSHLLIAILALFTGIVFAFFTSFFVSRPINEILADIEQIAGGDLDHQIGGGSGTEFARFRQSINTMVATLKENIDQIRNSERKIKCYSENLEEMVNRRTANLQLANEQLNVYLDIITRDIDHANMVTRSYLSLLTKKLTGENTHIAEHALEGAKENARIIRNVDILRRMYEENLQLKPVDLHQLTEEMIGEVKKRYPEIQIHYTGTDAKVLADDLLKQVFCNLISNSRKNGGPEVEIWISVEKRDHEVEITVADNGPGIPDPVKQTLFCEHDPRMRWATGLELGLYVIQSIVEWYGGSIWVENRVKERPEAGVAIKFTLKLHKNDQ